MGKPEEHNETEHKRVITVQDISCFGQCSITVALPIMEHRKKEKIQFDCLYTGYYGFMNTALKAVLFVFLS